MDQRSARVQYLILDSSMNLEISTRVTEYPTRVTEYPTRHTRTGICYRAISESISIFTAMNGRIINI